MPIMLGPDGSEHITPEDDDRDIAAAFFDGALEALDAAWSAIHIKRFDADDNLVGGPDNFYNGTIKARIEVDRLRSEYRRQREQVVD